MDITATVKPTDRFEWRAWLEANHAGAREIWLLFDRRADVPGVSYLDAVEEAICFGWIDGIAKLRNEHERAQRFTPRRPRSNWTELNKERARRLIQLGLMTPAGLATLPDLDAPFEVPESILQALRADPEVWERFEALPELYRRIRVGYIAEQERNRPEFERRLASFIAKTREGKLFGNWTDGGRLG